MSGVRFCVHAEWTGREWYWVLWQNVFPSGFVFNEAVVWGDDVVRFLIQEGGGVR
jgi:hypothetical protein